VDFTFHETIKIGICADLDEVPGKDALEGAVLASEQVNAEGGILGRYLEIISEDNDEETRDMTKVSAALTKLITFHKVDFVIGGFVTEATLVMQDIIADHKKIFINICSPSDTLTQRVVDDYAKYKYYFRVTPPNATTIFREILNSLVVLREYSGFNKVAYLAEDLVWTKDMRAGLDYYLPEVYGFDLVYRGTFPLETIDFTSYFAVAEAAGTEILVPLISHQEAILFIKEWYERQSPLIIWGANLVAESGEYWKWTEGMCEHEVTMVSPFIAGYPFTSKTLPAREAYIDKWGHIPTMTAHGAYDTIRYILPDAIKRAGTIETDAVIEALEETDIETTDSPRFMFTSSHDLMFGPGYTRVIFFQWQANETRVPVYPKEIMEEASATYTYPSWPGPWD